jgi:hypothetical protein
MWDSKRSFIAQIRLCHQENDRCRETTRTTGQWCSDSKQRHASVLEHGLHCFETPKQIDVRHMYNGSDVCSFGYQSRFGISWTTSWGNVRMDKRVSNGYRIPLLIHSQHNHPSMLTTLLTNRRKKWPFVCGL